MPEVITQNPVTLLVNESLCWERLVRLYEFVYILPYLTINKVFVCTASQLKAQSQMKSRRYLLGKFLYTGRDLK